MKGLQQSLQPLLDYFTSCMFMPCRLSPQQSFLMILSQPLTEPAVIPLTSDFCAMKMNSAVGIVQLDQTWNIINRAVGMVESVIAAAMLPHSTA